MPKTSEILKEQVSIKIEINKLKEYLLKLETYEFEDKEQANECKILIENKIKDLLGKYEENKELFIEKLDRLLFVVGTKQAEVEFYKSKKRDIENKIKSTENNIQWLKNLIEDGCNRYKLLEDFNKVKTTNFSIGYNTRPALEIDLNTLPNEYKKEKITLEANKDEINKDLDKGIDIKGVKRVHNLSIRGLNIKNNEKNSF